MVEMEHSLYKAVRWLDSNIDKFICGNYPLEALYKLPLALAINNKFEIAERVVYHLKNTYSNEFHFSDEYDNKRYCDIYYDFWILMYEVYVDDISLSDCYKRLLNSYNSRLGAFNSRFFSSKSEFYEVRATAIGAIIAYLMNDDKVLNQCSAFLIDAYCNNAKLYGKNKFYYLFDAHGNVLLHEGETKVTMYHRRQESVLYYAFYLASIALSLMHIKSNKKIYIDYAENYTCYFDLNNERVKYNSYSGKLAFNSALLYALTGNAKYLQVCEDVLTYMVKSQEDDGVWRFAASGTAGNEIMAIDRTSEFSVWLRMVGNLLKKNSLLRKGGWITLEKIPTSGSII